MLCALSAGLFACKKKNPSPSGKVTEEDLALQTVNEAIPNGEDNAATAKALLALFRKADMEEGEIVDALSALKAKGKSVAPAMIAVEEKLYTTDLFPAIRDALQVVADAVSPEVAGEVFYAAATDYSSKVPYTLSDCRKLAAFYFSQNTTFGSNVLNDVLNGEVYPASRKELNTVLVTLSASLHSMAGISEEARNYLSELAKSGISSLVTTQEKLSDESQAIIDKSKALLYSVFDVLRDHYDLSLTYFSNFLSFSDARLFLGSEYDKKELTLYYGYHYDGWTVTEITEEQYTKQEGDYDEYVMKTFPMKGHYVGDDFVGISDKDVLLAEKAYRFHLAYRAYRALTEEEKAEFRTALHEILTLLSEDPDFLATMLKRDKIKPTGTIGATFDEMLNAFSSLADIDPTDGFDNQERDKAKSAERLFESYLHGYLPELF